MRRTPFVVLGAGGVAVGCAGMVTMLPGAVAVALGALGITGSSAVVRMLSPVAEPLYITSAALVVVGALMCSRLVTLLAGAGTTLLYLSMFQLASGMSGGSMSMTSMQADGSASSPSADVPTFYSGLVLLAAAIFLMTWRRHRRACHPLVRLPRTLTVRR